MLKLTALQLYSLTSPMVSQVPTSSRVSGLLETPSRGGPTRIDQVLAWGWLALPRLLIKFRMLRVNRRRENNTVVLMVV